MAISIHHRGHGRHSQGRIGRDIRADKDGSIIVVVVVVGSSIGDCVQHLTPRQVWVDQFV
jgi:hypothetical protein